jgi:bacteriorhodopsin
MLFYFPSVFWNKRIKLAKQNNKKQQTTNKNNKQKNKKPKKGYFFRKTDSKTNFCFTAVALARSLFYLFLMSLFFFFKKPCLERYKKQAFYDLL